MPMIFTSTSLFTVIGSRHQKPIHRSLFGTKAGARMLHAGVPCLSYWLAYSTTVACFPWLRASPRYIHHLPSRDQTTPSNANTIYLLHVVSSLLQIPCCSPSCLSLTSYAILTISATHATVPLCAAFGCKGHHSLIYPFPINTINTMSIKPMELETWELEAWYANGPMPEAMAKSSFRVHV